MVNRISPRNNALLGTQITTIPWPFATDFDTNHEGEQVSIRKFHCIFPRELWFEYRSVSESQLWFGLVARVGDQASFDLV